MADRRLYETHMHTPLCKHAEGEIAAYAAVAEQHGLAGIIVTCHNPLPDGFSGDVRMAENEWDTYLRMVAEARAEWRGRIDIRLGLECDYYPRFESHLRRQVVAADFAYLLGSVHAHLRVWRECFQPVDSDELLAVYVEQILRVAECGLFDTVAHPELLLAKKCLSADFDPRRFLDAMDARLPRIAATGVAMELNTSAGLSSERGRAYMPDLLRLYHQHGVSVVVGSDAHRPQRVADRWPVALRMLADAGFATVGCVLDRRRHEIPLTDATTTLAAPPSTATGDVAANLDFTA